MVEASMPMRSPCTRPRSASCCSTHPRPGRPAPDPPAGRDNVQKRYFVHVAGYNLGLVMRQLIGAGTPKELAARGAALLWLLDPERGLLLILILPPDLSLRSVGTFGSVGRARGIENIWFFGVKGRCGRQNL
jgi:hypothetical protein